MKMLYIETFASLQIQIPYFIRPQFQREISILKIW